MASAEQVAFTVVPPAMFFGSGIVGLARAPSNWVRSGVLHLAAGVVFAVVAVELIPDLLRDHRPIETVIGFAVGVATMLGVRSLTHTKEKHEREERESLPPDSVLLRRLPLGMLAGIAIDLGVDGFMIGIGFAAGAKEGRMLAMALAVELTALGFALSASMSKTGVPRARSLAALGGLGATFVTGAVLGTTVLSKMPTHWLAGVLAFGCAALLFLVTEELLTEAHEAMETPTLTAMFFVGFLAFLVLGMMS